MAKPYSVTIINGSGTSNILSGDYTVTTQTSGYDNTSIDPSTITIDKITDTYSFTVSATGTLTLHVSENGSQGGTAVVGATFIRCDSLGNEYGNEISSDSNGNAIFNNVPFATENAPLIYYKQKISDGEHEFDNTLKSLSMLTSLETVEVTNSIPLTRTINYTDNNYSGLPIDSGQITLS